MPKAPIKIAFCGDSITDGSISYPWVEELSKLYSNSDKYEIEKFSQNSLTTISWPIEFLQKVIDYKPNIISILLGTNDCNGAIRFPDDFSLESFEKKLSNIVSELQKNTKAKIALSSIPPIGEDPTEEIFIKSGEYSLIIKKIARDKKCTYLPVYEKFVTLLALKNKKLQPTFSYPQWAISIGVAMIKKRILGKSYEEISREEGNLIHVDYLHLNDSAMELVKLNKDFIDSYHKPWYSIFAKLIHGTSKWRNTSK